MVNVYHDRVVMEALKSGANDSANGDYSSAEGVFVFTASRALQINKITIRMKCSGFTGDGFGDSTALGTTIYLSKENSSETELLDLTYGIDIVSNDDLLLLVDNDLALSGKNFIGSSYYSADTSAMKMLTGERIVARFNDDMSARVTDFNIIVEGVYENAA
jgi:hypothetical protein